MMLQRSPNKWVKNVVKLCGLVTWCLLTGLWVGSRPVQAADAVVGTGTPASCTEGTFDTALTAVQNGGGTITFNCGPDIHSIEFLADSNGKNIDTNVVINAANKIVLNARHERRHFYVSGSGRLTLQNITLVQGYHNIEGGSSIYNLGALTLEGATIRDSNVDGNNSGGAILSNGGAVTITDSLLENNTGDGRAGGLYLIGETADVTITHSTFRNNRTTNANFGFGGAILTENGADVTIRNSRLEGNRTFQGGGIYNEFAATTITIEADTKLMTNTATEQGGGIYNLLGTLIISHSILSGNSAVGGGGIFNQDSLTVISSTLSGNSAFYGGGIENNGTLTISTSLLDGNLAKDANGGGIANAGTLTISNSTFLSNSAPFGGGGIFNNKFKSNGVNFIGTLTVISSTLSGNSADQGGGIFNNSALTVSTSLLSGNSANLGGGIYNADSLTVSNSTLSGNSASQNGGGLFNTERNTSLLHIDSSTFADNSANAGGGVYNRNSPITISNSIIANSPKGGDCAGTITNGDHNLIEDNSCNFSGGNDPKLGPLQDNGGPTLTHALLSGSPAIDTGASTLATDQRGVIRPQGSAVDIGAFELERQVGAATIYLPLISKQ